MTQMDSETDINPGDSALNNDHQDINRETQHGMVLDNEREMVSGVMDSLVEAEACPNDASTVPVGDGSLARVISPEAAEEVQIQSSSNEQRDASSKSLAGVSEETPNAEGQNKAPRGASPMFKPLLDSVLHQFPPKVQQKEPLFLSSPLSEIDDPLEVLSLHSSSSEAGNDDGIRASSHDSLFDPPLSSDDDVPLSELKRNPRLVMSHVQMPPLRRPKSDYQRVFPPKEKLKAKKPKAVQSHLSLIDALQSALAHNHDIHDDEDRVVVKKTIDKKKNVQRNAVAGPSKLPSRVPRKDQSTSSSRKVPRHASSTAPQPPSSSPAAAPVSRSKSRRKRRFVESSPSSDEGERRGSNLKGKRPRITIDLTLTDDENDDAPIITSGRDNHSTPPSPVGASDQPPAPPIPSFPPQSSPFDTSTRLSSPPNSRKNNHPSVSETPSFSHATPTRVSRSITPQHLQTSGSPYQHRIFLQHFPFLPPPSVLRVNTCFYQEWWKHVPSESSADDVSSSSLPVDDFAAAAPGSSKGSRHSLTTRASEAVGFSRIDFFSGRYARASPHDDDEESDLVSLGYVSLALTRDDEEYVENESEFRADPDADVASMDLDNQRETATPAPQPVERPEAAANARNAENLAQPEQEDVRPVRIDLVAALRKSRIARGKQKQQQRRLDSDTPAATAEISHSSSLLSSSVPAPAQHPARDDPLKSLLVTPTASGGGTSVSTPSGSDPLELVYPASDEIEPQAGPSQNAALPHASYHLSSLPSSSNALSKGFTHLPSPAGTFPNPYAVRKPLGDLDVFMHNYGTGPSSPELQPSTPDGSMGPDFGPSASTGVGVGAGSSTVPDPTGPTGPTGLGGPNDPHDPFPDLYALTLPMNDVDMQHFHQSDEILSAAAVSRGGSGSGSRATNARLPFPLHLNALNMTESWMTTGQSQSQHQHGHQLEGAMYGQGYGFDTVDPTLIGGFVQFGADDDGDREVERYLEGDDEDGRSVAASEPETSADSEGGALASVSATVPADERVTEHISGIKVGERGTKKSPTTIFEVNDAGQVGSVFNGSLGVSSVRSHSPAAQSPSSTASSSSFISPTSSAVPLPTSLTSMDGSPNSVSSPSSPSKVLHQALGTALPPTASRARSPSALSSVSEALSMPSAGPPGPGIMRFGSSPLSDLTSLTEESSVLGGMIVDQKPVTFPKGNRLEVVIVQKRRKPASGWEEHVVDADIYCHQCRSKNGHRKTRCACKARYCARCVAVRPNYLEILKPGGRVYSCPRCDGWCTCTRCCEKRGEDYLPVPTNSKSMAPPALPIVPSTLDKAIHSPPSLLSLPATTSVLQKHPSARLSSTTSTPHLSPVSNRSSLSPVGPPPSYESGRSAYVAPTPLAKKSRVFIGKPQSSWGLGKTPRTREVNPAPRTVWPKKPSGPCIVRYYIGDVNFIQHKQVRLQSTDDLLAGITGIADLEASDDDDDRPGGDGKRDQNEPATLSVYNSKISAVNNDISNAPPPRLCQRDVAKALLVTYESLSQNTTSSDDCPKLCA